MNTLSFIKTTSIKSIAEKRKKKLSNTVALLCVALIKLKCIKDQLSFIYIYKLDDKKRRLPNGIYISMKEYRQVYDGRKSTSAAYHT